MTRQLAIAAIPLLALSACAAEMDSDEFVSDAPAATIVGEAERCLNRALIRSTEVQDARTIDFETTGGETYRNILPYRCPGLAVEDSFTYETSLNQLCSTDIIYPLHQYGGTPTRGAGCGLGEFVPIEYIEDGE